MARNTAEPNTNWQNDPDFYRPKSRFDAAPKQNVEVMKPEEWGNIKGVYLISPISGGDGRVLVKEDPPTSKFDCVDCGGAGHKGVICKYCKGTKFDKGDEENGYCRDCTIGDTSSGIGRTLGFDPCPTCHGKGGTIIIPDEAKKNTTMGTVIAISSNGINVLKINDRVIYTNYTGTQFKMLDEDLRVIIEKDILGKIKQLKANADAIVQGEYADLANTGVVHE